MPVFFVYLEHSNTWGSQSFIPKKVLANTGNSLNSCWWHKVIDGTPEHIHSDLFWSTAAGLNAHQSFFFFYFTILYWFCHTSTWIRHGCTRVPNPESPSHLPPHTIPLGHPSAQPQASCILHWTWTADSFLIWYYTCFNAIPPNHHPLPLPQSPKVCSIHLCLFCCLTYRVIITIFLKSIYMC